MTFTFFQYISPIWYYRLIPAEGRGFFFSDYDKLSPEEQVLIEFDEAFSTREASKLDAAWQAWNKGFMFKDGEKALDTLCIQPSLQDNYRFVRKYFHFIWSWYVLMLRICSLKAPWKEISAFWHVRKIPRAKLFKRVYRHESGYNSFKSRLLQESPKLSVIIPTLNRYEYLGKVLKDLEQQSYANFDVIIIDQSEPFRKDFYKDFTLDIKLSYQREKALWLARNTAIQQSDSTYLLLSEDDVRIPKDWIFHHLKCLEYFQADISSGVFFPENSVIPPGKSFFRWSEQFATGNACLKKEIFNKIGLFDRQFEKQRMGDGEFGLRAYLSGFKSISNPHAFCIDVKAPVGGLRQMGSWDGFRPKSWLSPRPVPSVLYLARKYFGNRAALRLLLINVPASLLPYNMKRKPKLLLLGLPLLMIIFPLVFWQVMRSWKESSRMLTIGSKIAELN